MTPWESYTRYLYDFHPILRDMSRRGVPVSEVHRLALGDFLAWAGEKIDTRIKGLVKISGYFPGTLKPLKRTPKDLTGFTQIEVIIEKEERCQCLKSARASCVHCAGTGMLPPGLVIQRWAKVVEFNPNSSQQVKRFIKFLKHPVPKHAKRTDAVTGEAAETTEKKELERLAVKTGHPIYRLMIEKREITKHKGTYVEGWEPARDGAVHTTYTFGPATWQMASKSPNVQNGLKHAPHNSLKEVIALGFNRMQHARPGHMMMNFDFKSFHAQTTACEAGLGDYLRLAKIDIHSFVACHYLRLPERVGLLERPDEEMAAIFKRLKKDQHFKYIRDFKAKRTILGIQFAMFWRKLYQLNPEDFEGEKEARKLWELIMVDLFPGLGKWQQSVKNLVGGEYDRGGNLITPGTGFLENKFGAVRRFYDVHRWSHAYQKVVGGDDAEAAVAFLPASSAFGHVRDVLLSIRSEGLDERYQLVNSIHDSLVFHCPNDYVAECATRITGYMSAPSTTLIYPICLGGLSVEAECSVGVDLASMGEWKGGFPHFPQVIHSPHVAQCGKM